MPIKCNTKKRNDKIRARFRVLYEEERKRIDDVYDTLVEEFFISMKRIEQIVAHKEQ
jgi:hypothetical protein